MIGLTEIGNDAFLGCSTLKHANIPSTVKTIGGWTYFGAPLQTLYLPDSVESIGTYTFRSGRFPNVRIPSRITTINDGVFYNCSSMFSAELPETITRFEGGRDYGGVFDNCRSLRNVAVPCVAVTCVKTFEDCKDLLQLFGSKEQITNALKHRFNNLPIHKMIYYHSYNNLTMDLLNDETNMRSNHSRALRQPESNWMSARLFGNDSPTYFGLFYCTSSRFISSID